jgi:hypothetical protein
MYVHQNDAIAFICNQKRRFTGQKREALTFKLDHSGTAGSAKKAT